MPSPLTRAAKACSIISAFPKLQIKTVMRENLSIEKASSKLTRNSMTPDNFFDGMAWVGIKSGDGWKFGYIDTSGKYIWGPQ